METIHLIGAEDVLAAGRQMSSAAQDMCRASSNFDSSIETLRRILDEHASRIEAALTAPQQNSVKENLIPVSKTHAKSCVTCDNIRDFPPSDLCVACKGDYSNWTPRKLRHVDGNNSRQT